jgi:AcrR family transcriptional regulator
MSKSKQKILKEAGELFSEFGFTGVSMGDIAKRLGVTKAALYFHFKSKKEIYLKVLEKAFQGLIEVINEKVSKTKSLKDAIFGLISGYLNFGLRNKNLIKASILKFPEKDPEIEKVVIKLRKELQGKFQEVLQKNKIFKKVDLHFLIVSLLGIMDGLILEAVLFGKKLNIKKSTFRILKILKI